MAENETAEEKEGVDEHGLVIHEYASRVLVLVPAEGFSEMSLRYARSALHNIHVGTVSASTKYDELVHGELQDEFQVDRRLDASLSMEEFSGLLLPGGSGTKELAENADALRLVREAAAADKLIGACGSAVEILARAGVVAKRRVTGAPACRDAVRSAGGRFTGTQLETDRNLVTALDDAAGFRFAKALAAVVPI